MHANVHFTNNDEPTDTRREKKKENACPALDYVFRTQYFQLNL